uniref:Chitin-binding type-2 domain-containing protein n=1 Tax=Bracon brevicornis TaxID=1563983 RepID=A0A6V7K3P5_9HYME
MPGEGELTAYEFRCPYGLVFDETSVACQWPRLVSACSKVNGVKYGSSTESSEKLNRRLTTKEEIDEARIIYLKQKPDIVTFPQEYEKFPEQTNFHKNQLNSNDPLSVTNVRQREPSVNGNDHFNDGINYSFTTTRRTPTTYLNNDRVNRPTHSPIEIDTTDISSNNLAKEEDDQRIDTMINVDKGAKTNVNHSNNVIANPKTSHKVQNITTVTPSGIVGMRADGLFNDGLISDVNYSIQIMNNHTSTILRNYSNLIPMFSKESNGSTEKTEIYISMASNSSSGIGITPASSYQPPQNYKFDEKNSKLNFDSNREVPLFDQHLHRTTERVTSSSSESIEMTNVNQALDSNVNSKNPAIADIIKSSTSGYSTVEFGEYEETTSGSMKPEKTEERLENTKLLALNNSYMDRIIHSAHEYDKIGFDRMTSNFPSQIDVTPVFLFNSTDGYYENEEDERIQHTVREFNASEHKKENKNLQNYSGGSTQKVTLVSTQFTPAIWPTEIFDINKNIRTSPMRYHIQSTTSVSSPAIFRMLNSDQGLISKNSVTEIVIDNETIQPHHVISPTLINSYERNPFLKDKAVSNHRLPNGKTESLAVINRDTLLDGDRDSNNLNKIVKSTYMRNPFLNKEQAMKEEGPHHKENEEDDGKFPDELTTVSTRNRNHDSTSIESRVDRGSIIVKYSDLHPILLRKLKAECKCSADPFGGFRYSKQPLFIDSSIGAIDLRNYDETNVYVDLGLPKKTVEKTAKFFNNVNSELTTANLLDPSNNIIGRVHSARDNAARDARSFPNFRQIHHSKDMVDNVDSSLFDKIECARPGLFRDTKFCNKFYTCHWDKWQNKFIPRIFNCPVHLAINDETGGCNWPSNGPACQNNQLLL